MNASFPKPAPALPVGREFVATHVLAAMLANPEFEPAKDVGEDVTEAYARRAVDYADALLAELHRRRATSSTREGT